MIAVFPVPLLTIGVYRIVTHVTTEKDKEEAAA